MASPLTVYLRNHEAAGQAGRDLFRRVAASQRNRPYGPELDRLLIEVDTDLGMLRKLLSRHRVRPDPVLALALRAGEKVGRLKTNGSLLTRAALTDLIEIEGLIGAVRAKATGWDALTAAAGPADAAELETLRQRAVEQLTVLTEIHRQVAARVIGPD